MRAWPLVVMPLAFAGALAVQARIDARGGAFRSQEEVLYLWSGEQIRRLSLGFDALLADIYWLRTVQYFGGQRAFAREKRFELLQPLVEITTTLDPRLEIAYRYGSIFLAEPPPVGAGKPEAAIALLQKGVRHQPNAWRLRQDLGLIYYYFLKDSQRASEVLMEASRVPGAPPWLEALGANILKNAGDRENARQVWSRLHAQSEEGIMKTNARIHLQRLDALDVADALAAQVKHFAAARGRNPSSLQGLGSRLPLHDPSGVPFDYDPGYGTVEIARSSPLFRID